MSHEWPIGEPAQADDMDGAEPLLPLAFHEHVELIRSSPAVAAIAAKRAVQIVTHGHSFERDLERPIGHLADEAKYRLTALTEIVGRGRMTLPPERREQCLRYIEIAGALILALWDRALAEPSE